MIINGQETDNYFEAYIEKILKTDSQPIKITEFSWNCGDEILFYGISEEKPNPIIAWADQAGTATWKDCSTYNTTKCIKDLEPLKINAPLVANFIFSKACDGVAVDFTDTSTGGDSDNYTYSWVFGDGGVSADQSPSHAASAGTYNVTLTVSDGVNSDSQTYSVEIYSSPIVDFSADQTSGYEPSEVQFTSDIKAGESPYSYEWAFGNGNTSTQANPLNSYNTGSYDVYLKVTDANGCFGEETKTNYINVTTKPQCTVDADCDDGNYCNGQEICNNGFCEAGTAVDCSENNLIEIGECGYNDGNQYKLYSRNPFTSVCGEGCSETDPGCSMGNEEIESTCNIGECGAECEVDTDCVDQDPNTVGVCNLNTCGCEFVNIHEPRTVDCVAKPDYTVWTTDNTYGQTCVEVGDGVCDEWAPIYGTKYQEIESSDPCQFECASGYDWDGQQCSLPVDSREVNCESKPSNTEWSTVSAYTQTCIESGEGGCINWDPTYNTKYQVSESNDPCQFICASGYTWDGQQCASSGGGGTVSSGGGGGGGGYIPTSLTITNPQITMKCAGKKIDLTMTWLTNKPATSRVVYDKVAQPDANLIGGPNYGYAYSTIEDPNKVTGHSVVISGLDDQTVYYFRPISSASPEVLGEEKVLTQTLTCGVDGDDDIIVLGEEGEPKLKITKIVSTPTAKAGDKGIEYTITVINEGNLDSFSTILTDELPAGLSFEDYEFSARMWELGDIMTGETKTITYKVNVNDDAQAGVYTNTASVNSDNHDFVSASANLEIEAIIVLAETGFDIIEFMILILGLFGAAGSSFFLRRKIA